MADKQDSIAKRIQEMDAAAARFKAARSIDASKPVTPLAKARARAMKQRADFINTVRSSGNPLGPALATAAPVIPFEFLDDATRASVMRGAQQTAGDAGRAIGRAGSQVMTQAQQGARSAAADPLNTALAAFVAPARALASGVQAGARGLDAASQFAAQLRAPSLGDVTNAARATPDAMIGLGGILASVGAEVSGVPSMQRAGRQYGTMQERAYGGDDQGAFRSAAAGVGDTVLGGASAAGLPSLAGGAMRSGVRSGLRSAPAMPRAPTAIPEPPPPLSAEPPPLPAAPSLDALDPMGLGVDTRRPNLARFPRRDLPPASIMDLLPEDPAYARELERISALEAQVGTPGLDPRDAQFIRKHRVQQQRNAAPLPPAPPPLGGVRPTNQDSIIPAIRPAIMPDATAPYRVKVDPLNTTGWTVQRYKLDKDGNPVPTMTGGVSAMIFDRNGEALVSTRIKPGQENKSIISEMGEYLAAEQARGSATNANPNIGMQEELLNIVRKEAGEPPLPPAPREKWTQESLARYQAETAAAQAAEAQAQAAKAALQQKIGPSRFRDVYDAFAEDMANPNYTKRPIDVRAPENAPVVDYLFDNWAARELTDPDEQQLARQAQAAASAATAARNRIQTRLGEVSQGSTLYSGLDPTLIGKLFGKKPTAAKAAPLDMSPEARMARSQEMGFVHEGAHTVKPVSSLNKEFYKNLYEGTPEGRRYLELENKSFDEGGLTSNEADEFRALKDDLKVMAVPKFDAFDPARTGQATDAGFYGPGVYIQSMRFSDSEFKKTGGYSYGSVALGGYNIPVKVRMSNPFVQRRVPSSDGRYVNAPETQAMFDALDDAIYPYDVSPVQQVGKPGNTLSLAELGKRFATALQKAGFDGVINSSKPYVKGQPIDEMAEIVVFDPRNIRSVNAAFDPAKADSANLLYSGLDPTLVGKMFGKKNEMGFFRSLERALDTPKAPTKADAQTWQAWLRNQPGVKAEEIEATGVTDWLATRQGPVTRDEVAAFVGQNGVRVEEVKLGGKGLASGPSPEQIARQEFELEWAERSGNWEGWLYDAALRKAKAKFKALPENVQDTYYGPEDYMDQNGGVWRQFTPAELERFKDEAWDAISLTYRERAADRIRDGDYGHNGGDDGTKWSSLTLPGGENYTELLLKLPAEPRGSNIGNLQSSHWDEPNVLAHVRFKDRTGPNGERILALEEVQSDWHQAGREDGYIGRLPKHFKIMPMNDAKEWVEQNFPNRGPWGRSWGDTSTGWAAVDTRDGSPLLGVWGKNLPSRQAAIDRFNDRSVPDAPFKNNAWAALALKRVIAKAVDEGYDSVAWIPGTVKNGKQTAEPQDGWQFYDQIMPNIANDIGKKYGARSGRVNLDGVDFHELRLTPQMRERVSGEGLPLFALPGALAIGAGAGLATQDNKKRLPKAPPPRTIDPRQFGVGPPRPLD